MGEFECACQFPDAPASYEVCVANFLEELGPDETECLDQAATDYPVLEDVYVCYEGALNAYNDCRDTEGCGGAAGGVFVCGDGESIPGDWRCDGEADCADGSDEQGCSGASTCLEGFILGTQSCELIYESASPEADAAEDACIGEVEDHDE